MTTLAWHFVGETLRDGRPVPADGEWLERDGDLVMCESGLHASERIIDALDYAPGNIICRVEVDGDIIRDHDKLVADHDKLVARRRRILWRIEGSQLLCAFARWCALQVINYWNAPAVVREYLETGNESISAAAWAAASAAARAAAWAAAWDAAWDAARAAASAAASAAARAAASAAARGAAARAAARAAAWAAARGDAARAAQNEHLTQLVEAEHAKMEAQR